MRKKLLAIIHSVAAICILLISSKFSDIIFMLKVREPFESIVYSIFYITCAFILVYAYSRYIMHLHISDLRLRKPSAPILCTVAALLLPLMVTGFYLLFTKGTFASVEAPFSEKMREIIRTVFVTGLAAGIVEELVFRGMIMKSIEIGWNKKVAVLLPSLCFAFVHLGNIEISDTISVILLLIGGTVVGIMFSSIVYYNDSIWAGSLVHGIWNIVIIGGILEIAPVHYFTRVWTYTFETKNSLLTGGSFGIETGLPAILGYITIIMLVSKGNRGPYSSHKDLRKQ